MAKANEKLESMVRQAPHLDEAAHGTGYGQPTSDGCGTGTCVMDNARMVKSLLINTHPVVNSFTRDGAYDKPNSESCSMKKNILQLPRIGTTQCAIEKAGSISKSAITMRRRNALAENR